VKYSSLPNLNHFSKIRLTNDKFFEQYEIIKVDLSKFKQVKKKSIKIRRKRKLKRLNSNFSYVSTDSVESIDDLNPDLSTVKLIKNKTNQKENNSSIKTSNTFKNIVNYVQDENSSIRRTICSDRTISDMGNAAQLPKGIENIRDHLEKEIDNVPLHVSLFTDSTKPAISQMICIMKKYGEIVGCFGSSHTIENNEIFYVSNIRFKYIFLI
jgi:hypothetical protein